MLALPPEGAKVKGEKKNPTLTAQFSAFQIPSLTVLVRIHVVTLLICMDTHVNSLKESVVCLCVYCERPCCQINVCFFCSIHCLF